MMPRTGRMEIDFQIQAGYLETAAELVAHGVPLSGEVRKDIGEARHNLTVDVSKRNAHRYPPNFTLPDSRNGLSPLEVRNLGISAVLCAQGNYGANKPRIFKRR